MSADQPKGARELQARIDRTLDYTDSLLRLSNLAPDLILTLQAVRNSLTTPISPDARL